MHCDSLSSQAAIPSFDEVVLVLDDLVSWLVRPPSNPEEMPSAIAPEFTRRRVSPRLANPAPGVAIRRRSLQVKRLFRRLCETPEPRVSERLAYVFADEGSGPATRCCGILSDQQNTVRDVAKYASTTAGSQATVRNHLEYDAYGNVTSVDDPSTGTANDGDFRAWKASATNTRLSAATPAGNRTLPPAKGVRSHCSQDNRRRPRTAPDVKKERQKRLADALAAQELETRRVDICKPPATASTNKPPGDPPSGGRSTARKVFFPTDCLEVFEAPSVVLGRNSFEIRGRFGTLRGLPCGQVGDSLQIRRHGNVSSRADSCKTRRESRLPDEDGRSGDSL
jgi:hypothetical protein